MTTTTETPSNIARRLGLVGNLNQHLTFDALLDLAVRTYWARRPKRRGVA